MTIYDVELTTITPLHIGDGMVLHNAFDFTADGVSTSRLNEEAILSKYSSKLQPKRDGSYPSPAELLTIQDREDPLLFRYTVSGVPRSNKGFSELRSCIKNAFDRPYIPGSSLKGSIRTALAWAGFQEEQLTTAKIDLYESNPKEVGKNLERELFGRDPNHSLMRALQVSDLFINEKFNKPGGGIRVFNIQVITHKSTSLPIALEGVRKGISFNGTIKVDDTLFSIDSDQTPYASDVRRKLGFEKHSNWLDTICERTTRNSKERADRLANWFSSVEGGEGIANFYTRLVDVTVGRDFALMQLGWGTGWDGMTFGALLKKDPVFFEKIVDKYHMNKTSRTGVSRKIGDTFPKSRRVIVEDKSYFAPLGWVMLEFKERKV